VTTTDALPEPVALVVQKVIRGHKGAPDTYKYDFVLCDPALGPSKLYTATQMHDYAARVSAAKDARMKRIEQYGVEWQNQALNLRAAAKQALEALELCILSMNTRHELSGKAFVKGANATESLRAAMKGTTP
jgi:hypothetical protein